MQNKEDVLFYQADRLKFEIHPTRELAGHAAAVAAAEEMRRLGTGGKEVAVIFATGASQLAMLDALTAIQDLNWPGVIGFHMDEYLGIDANHPASFRRYMRERLVQKVSIGKFLEIQGDPDRADRTCEEYAAELKRWAPQLCLLGIGENGHLAFNDPFVTDLSDPKDVRIVNLDAECKAQQVAEGWFPDVGAVPAQAITLTVPTLYRVPKLIIPVPGLRKASIIRRVIDDAVSNACPATVLKTHPDATVYLDRDSSSELGDLLSH